MAPPPPIFFIQLKKPASFHRRVYLRIPWWCKIIHASDWTKRSRSLSFCWRIDYFARPFLLWVNLSKYKIRQFYTTIYPFVWPLILISTQSMTTTIYFCAYNIRIQKNKYLLQSTIAWLPMAEKENIFKIAKLEKLEKTFLPPFLCSKVLQMCRHAVVAQENRICLIWKPTSVNLRRGEKCPIARAFCE